MTTFKQRYEKKTTHSTFRKQDKRWKSIITLFNKCVYIIDIFILKNKQNNVGWGESRVIKSKLMKTDKFVHYFR